jgi:hypothetical protein
MFKKIEKPAACEMRSVIRFLNARNMKPADIYRQLCEVYREHAMSDSMVRRWMRHFTHGHENVYDDLQSGRPHVVRAVEQKILENRRFIISSLSLRTGFWDRTCVLHVEFLPEGSTVNAGVYCDTLRNCVMQSRTSDVACLVGMLWCFLTMPAHTLPPKHKIHRDIWLERVWSSPLQPRLSAKWFVCVPASENVPRWPAVPRWQWGHRSC